MKPNKCEASILPRSFYDRDTLTVARELLGKHLVHIVDGTALVGRITETEAYIGRMDKACHAYGYKRTARTETLFAKPGTAYVYLIYGMYCCLNFVTEAEGEPCAVLIRGVEPVEGSNTISQLRFGCDVSNQSAYQRKNFLNGPGKLCKGFSIDRHCNNLDLTVPPLFVSDGDKPSKLHTGKRIGIDYAEEAVDFPWRFWT
ncbi:MAG: DNA-3-methyladenine glycosylase [Oscillospiraceae bacterium]|nr:DNA-3-methyladenine glycosylase [Oscillospiraceae bacterium]